MISGLDLADFASIANPPGEEKEFARKAFDVQKIIESFQRTFTSIEKVRNVFDLYLVFIRYSFCLVIAKQVHRLMSFCQRFLANAVYCTSIRSFWMELPQYWSRITSYFQCKKPVIVAVHGACVGGGIDLITACDVRYCTNDAMFQVKVKKWNKTAKEQTPARVVRSHMRKRCFCDVLQRRGERFFFRLGSRYRPSCWCRHTAATAESGR